VESTGIHEEQQRHATRWKTETGVLSILGELLREVHKGIREGRDSHLGRPLRYILRDDNARFATVGEGLVYTMRDTLAASDSLCVDYADYPNDLAALFLLRVSPPVVEPLDIVPMLIDDFRVSRATGGTRGLIARRLKKLCAEVGTTLEESGDGVVVRVSRTDIAKRE
jgi:hypothetical protein